MRFFDNVVVNGVKYTPLIEVKEGDANIYEKALNCIIPNCDLGENITVRFFLYQLIRTLWREEEGFSGKRPFGNSCWQIQVHYALIQNGFINGQPDAYGNGFEYNSKEANKFIFDLISYIFITKE